MMRIVLISLFSLGFLATSVLGVFFAMGDGDMDGHCPLMAHTDAVCPVAVASHIGKWQQTFATVLETGVAVCALLALVVVGVDLLGPARRSALSAFALGRARAPDIRASADHLLAAFSGGVLHAKVYA